MIPEDRGRDLTTGVAIDAAGVDIELPLAVLRQPMLDLGHERLIDSIIWIVGSLPPRHPSAGAALGPRHGDKVDITIEVEAVKPVPVTAGQ